MLQDTIMSTNQSHPDSNISGQAPSAAPGVHHMTPHASRDPSPPAEQPHSYPIHRGDYELVACIQGGPTGALNRWDRLAHKVCRAAITRGEPRDKDPWLIDGKAHVA
ncbi:hypothetical protein SNOG_11531 [Parastagonospora nodorum SN15]|uniref:Uncharacterized protein n=1 Tax=Phaeosphaeria nodorum (strain SN15 / ATCC MYA-4574 / FGSC 10173) TaxID=321614 RepID=Q0U9N3_PHANO|nr:hypothetical protein SNOG_11531 [Parastagonospora nodorum SN15]EAT81239.1 hypothetical protein SNOG_11531 [Parastagonospora nodorum SN15]